MKLFFLAPGDSVHSLRWIEFFAQRGHEVHWASLEEFSVRCSDRIRTYVLAPVSSELHQVMKGAAALRALLKQTKPDVMHVHSAGRNGVVSLLTGFHPLVVTAWGSEILIAGKSRLIRPLLRWTLRNADLITCDAEHMRRAMIKIGADNHKISVVYFGTDTDRFVPKPKDSTLTAALGVDGKPTIISLRSLEPVYDVRTLLYAARSVIRQIPDARFVIVGDGSERSFLIQLAQSLNIQDQVRFTGKIENQLLPSYLTSADIYASTSHSDAGLAASTAEAMSCGLPVVVTDSGENKLWVENNKSGYVVAVQDPEALADRLLLLLRNPALQKQFGTFNRSVIEARNSYRVEMSKMEKLYEAIRHP